jgi:uncharacterized protein HemY
LYRMSMQQSGRAGRAFSALYTGLGILLMRTGSTSEAKEVLQSGANGAADAKLLEGFGELLNQEHEYDKDKGAPIRASQMDRSVPDPYYILGQLLTHSGQTSEAQQEFNLFRQLKLREVSAEGKLHRDQAIQFDTYLVRQGPDDASTVVPNRKTR